MKPHLQKYIDYMNNGRPSPLPVAEFDADWGPAGPSARRVLEAEGIIEYVNYCTGMRLRADLISKEQGR